MTNSTVKYLTKALQEHNSERYRQMHQQLIVRLGDPSARHEYLTNILLPVARALKVDEAFAYGSKNNKILVKGDNHTLTKLVAELTGIESKSRVIAAKELFGSTQNWLEQFSLMNPVASKFEIYRLDINNVFEVISATSTSIKGDVSKLVNEYHSDNWVDDITAVIEKHFTITGISAKSFAELVNHECSQIVRDKPSVMRETSVLLTNFIECLEAIESDDESSTNKHTNLFVTANSELNKNNSYTEVVRAVGCLSGKSRNVEVSVSLKSDFILNDGEPEVTINNLYCRTVTNLSDYISIKNPHYAQNMEELLNKMRFIEAIVKDWYRCLHAHQSNSLDTVILMASKAMNHEDVSALDDLWWNDVFNQAALRRDSMWLHDCAE
ncbi:hypothetical protein VCHA53O466_50360 [Vibrio chagasii]|nr:hypothetical protein VCHA53O466_50360 [Vibrio chagasii]